MSAEPSPSSPTKAIGSNRSASARQVALAHRECIQQVEGLQAHRNPLRQAGAKLPGLCLPRRCSCMVDLMGLYPSRAASVPAIYQFREYALAGGLISYGASITDMYRQVGRYVGRVL